MARLRRERHEARARVAAGVAEGRVLVAELAAMEGEEAAVATLRQRVAEGEQEEARRLRAAVAAARAEAG